MTATIPVLLWAEDTDTGETVYIKERIPASGDAEQNALFAIRLRVQRMGLRMSDPANFGRKRRARRARGRKIEAKRPYSSAALALAAVFKADAERAAAFRPFDERLAAVFARQVGTITHA